MVYTPMTSDLSPPPPPALSHHSPGPQTLSPVSGPENKVARRGPARLGPAQPSTIDPAFGDLFERAMKNRWTLRKGLRRGGERGRKKERESCKIFAKKNNPGTLSNYIYLSCVVLLGRPCGLPGCSMVHFSHYLILDGE